MVVGKGWGRSGIWVGSNIKKKKVIGHIRKPTFHPLVEMKKVKLKKTPTVGETMCVLGIGVWEVGILFGGGRGTSGRGGKVRGLQSQSTDEKRQEKVAGTSNHKKINK